MMNIEEMAEYAYSDHCPIKIVQPSFQDMIDESIKEGILGITYKWGFELDEDVIVQILKEDKERYKEAWKDGYDAGRRDTKDKLNKIRDILDEKEEK